MTNFGNPFGNKLTGQFRVLRTLTSRHLKMFFKNKMTFFFSLLVPLITLAIYLLFLRDLECRSVDAIIQTYSFTEEQIAELSPKVYGLVDAWMLSGILAISCISVSFNTCYVMISDKETGANKDFASSPISRIVIITSYFLFNFLVTLIICTLVFFICLIYLRIMNSFYFSILDFISIYGVVIISIVSATLFTILITSFISSGSTFNSLIAIFSAAVGFLIGGYMPIQMLPTFVQYMCGFFPGTYSAGILRTLFLRGQIDNVANYLSSINNDLSIIDTLKTQFLNVSFFGNNLNSEWMSLALIITTTILLLLNLVSAKYTQLRSLVGKTPKKHNKKVKKEE